MSIGTKALKNLVRYFSNFLKEQSHVCLFPRGVTLRKRPKKSLRIRPKASTPALDSIDFMKSNEAVVVATAYAMGVDVSSVDFSRFPGMERRQSILFEEPELTVVEDYAHHPAEIRAFVGDRRRKLP